MCACFCFMCAKHVRLPLFHVLLVLLALSNEVADAGSQGWAFSGAPSLFLLSSSSLLRCALTLPPLNPLTVARAYTQIDGLIAEALSPLVDSGGSRSSSSTPTHLRAHIPEALYTHERRLYRRMDDDIPQPLARPRPAPPFQTPPKYRQEYSWHC